MSQAKKGKAPAFQYYPSDIEAETAAMTLEEAGAHNRLLNAVWEQPVVAFDFTRLAAICRTTPAKMRKLWPALAPYFTVGDGRVTHPHLTAERIRQDDKSTKNRGAANARWNAERTDSGNANAYANASETHMRTECPSTTTSASPAELEQLVGEARPSDAQAVQQFAIALVVMANKGLADHADPRRRQPIPRIFPTQPRSLEAAEAILAAGVPRDFAESQVYAIASTHNADGAISSLRYFVRGVVRAWHQRVAQRAAEETPAPDAPPPSANGARRDARAGDQIEELEALEARYRAEAAAQEMSHAQ